MIGVRLFVVGEQLMCGYARLVGEPLICGWRATVCGW